MPAPEAHVVAHLLFRDAAQRVIQGVDAKLRPLAIKLRALLNQVVVHVRKHRVVHLNDEACLVDLEIFLTQGFGQREYVLTLIAVELVHAVEHGAGWRDGG